MFTKMGLGVSALMLLTLLTPVQAVAMVNSGSGTATSWATTKTVTDGDITLISKTVWGEARGCALDEQALVVWTILNRVDDGRFGSSIKAVVTARNQFQGYRVGNPVTAPIRRLVERETRKWAYGSPAPTLAPYATTSDYLYFYGTGSHNYFRKGG